MKTLTIFLMLLLAFQFSYAQLENVYKKQKESNEPKYFQDFLNFASDQENKTRLDVFIQVPYTEIQFVKNNDVFTASYLIVVSVFDESKTNLLVEKFWREKIEVNDFDKTISKGNFNLSLRSFHLEPSKYFITTSVEDEDSKRKYTSENIFIVRDLSKEVSISDIMLIARQTRSEGANTILPNLSRNLTAEKDGIPVFFEIYSEVPKDINVLYVIKDKDQKEIYSEPDNRQIEGGRTQVIHTIKDISLGLGNYTLDVKIQSDNETLASTNKNFVSRWTGIPSVIQDLDKAIDQLIYIATPGEISYIEDAENQEDKVKRYMEFWKKRDPTPDTEENEIFNEYYRRITYANENFSQYIEGWRSDRGMVFIILGSPSNIDRYPFNLQSKPYEVWQYYELNRRYVFVDETGFGDYRLVTPLYGDDFRFRN